MSVNYFTQKGREYRARLKLPGNEEKYAAYKQKKIEHTKRYRAKKAALMANSQSVKNAKRKATTNNTKFQSVKNTKPKSQAVKPAKSKTQSVNRAKRKATTKPAKSKATTKNTQPKIQIVKPAKPRATTIQEDVKRLKVKLKKDKTKTLDVLKSLGKEFNFHFYTVQTVKVKEESQ